MTHFRVMLLIFFVDPLTLDPILFPLKSIAKLTLTSAKTISRIISVAVDIYYAFLLKIKLLTLLLLKYRTKSYIS